MNSERKVSTNDIDLKSREVDRLVAKVTVRPPARLSVHLIASSRASSLAQLGYLLHLLHLLKRSEKPGG